MTDEIKSEEPEVSGKEFDFEEVVRINAEKEEKLKRERQQANNSVKKSYRLIPKSRK